MKIMIKRDVWRDARIPSLLVPKRAKGDRVRFLESLGSSKGEWTRVEDEKLLHLAKLMPMQWKTIAPIVGRSPSQCVERYGKLLDSAVNDATTSEQGDDPRKLRPGEIDPNPESKLAQPDPVDMDMDEDEKEMLSEACARLAKRKAREKQLEEARRLASLQKRTRKRKGIDYTDEIPFEKRPSPGFYDNVDEDRPVGEPKFPTTIEELDGETRMDKDAPAAIMQASKLNDDETPVRKMLKLLPPPKNSDQVREKIGRIGATMMEAENLARGKSSELHPSGSSGEILTKKDLPRSPAASVELIRHSLMRADEDKSSFVPPIDIEQADGIASKDLLSWLDFDNVEYLPSDKEKKKGVKRTANIVPLIHDFEEAELKEASSLIEEEAQYLRRAMGHEEDSLDEFVEAHRTCLNDLMYFPTRSAYGLSSAAGTAEKLSALQREFEHVKRKLDDDNQKAQQSERNVYIRTNGNKAREAKLREQIELTFNQINSSGTELDCLLALQRQEKAAASLRIKGLWEEIQKQKELKNSLQKRYGDIVAELERIQVLMKQYKIQAQQLEELEAKKQADDAEARMQAGGDEAKKQTEDKHNTVEVPEPVSMMMDVDVFNDVKLNNDVIQSLEKDTLTDPEVDCDQNVGDTINSDGNAGEAVESDNIEMVSSSEKELVGGEGHSTSGIVGKEAALDGDEDGNAGGLSSDVMPVRKPLWQRIKSYITSFDR